MVKKLKVSKKGYKRNSPDKGEKALVIPSGRITMQDVDFPVMGTDEYGNQILMLPGEEYQFPGNQVIEVPIKYQPGGSYIPQATGDLPANSRVPSLHRLQLEDEMNTALRQRAKLKALAEKTAQRAFINPGKVYKSKTEKDQARQRTAKINEAIAFMDPNYELGSDGQLIKSGRYWFNQTPTGQLLSGAKDVAGDLFEIGAAMDAGRLAFKGGKWVLNKLAAKAPQTGVSELGMYTKKGEKEIYNLSQDESIPLHIRQMIQKIDDADAWLQKVLPPKNARRYQSPLRPGTNKDAVLKAAQIETHEEQLKGLRKFYKDATTFEKNIAHVNNIDEAPYGVYRNLEQLYKENEFRQMFPDKSPKEGGVTSFFDLRLHDTDVKNFLEGYRPDNPFAKWSDRRVQGALKSIQHQSDAFRAMYPKAAKELNVELKLTNPGDGYYFPDGELLTEGVTGFSSGQHLISNKWAHTAPWKDFGMEMRGSMSKIGLDHTDELAVENFRKYWIGNRNKDAMKNYSKPYDNKLFKGIGFNKKGGQVPKAQKGGLSGVLGNVFSKPITTKDTNLPNVNIYGAKDKHSAAFLNTIANKNVAYEPGVLTPIEPSEDFSSERYEDIWKSWLENGRPKIREIELSPNKELASKGRAHYYGGNQNTMFIPYVPRWNGSGSSPVYEYFAELSHAKQALQGEDMSRDWRKYGDSENYDKNAYTTPGDLEYEAHKVIQPKLFKQYYNYQKGGRTPITVTDPNDPRLKAYNDSLLLYNAGENQIKELNKIYKNSGNSKNISLSNSQYLLDIVPTAVTKAADRLKVLNNQYPNPVKATPFTVLEDGVAGKGSIYQFKKPVQPVVYQKPQQSPIKKEQLSYEDSLRLYNEEKRIYEKSTGLSYDKLLTHPRTNVPNGPAYGYTLEGVPIHGYKKPVGTSQPQEPKFKRPGANPSSVQFRNEQLPQPVGANKQFEVAKWDPSQPTNYSFTAANANYLDQNTFYFPDREMLDTFIKTSTTAQPSQYGQGWARQTGYMKKKGGKIKKAQKGGRAPITVTDPNDPRLRLYNDSLVAYNRGLQAAQQIAKGIADGYYKRDLTQLSPEQAKKKHKESLEFYNNSLVYPYIHGKLPKGEKFDWRAGYFKIEPTDPSLIEAWKKQNQKYLNRKDDISSTDVSAMASGTVHDVKETFKAYQKYNGLKVKPQGMLPLTELAPIYKYKKPVQPVVLQEEPVFQIPGANPSSVQFRNERLSQPVGANKQFEVAKWDASKPTSYSFTAANDQYLDQNTFYFPDREMLDEFIKTNTTAQPSQYGKGWARQTGYMKKKGGKIKKAQWGIDLTGETSQFDEQGNATFIPGQGEYLQQAPLNRPNFPVITGTSPAAAAAAGQLNTPSQPSQLKRKNKLQLNPLAGLNAFNLALTKWAEAMQNKEMENYNRQMIMLQNQPGTRYLTQEEQYGNDDVYQIGGIVPQDLSHMAPIFDMPTIPIGASIGNVGAKAPKGVAAAGVTPQPAQLSGDMQEYATKANKYLQRKFPKTDITGEMLAAGAQEAFQKYGKVVPVELALAQLQVEGYLAQGDKPNKPQRTKNPFNVGNTDDNAVINHNSVQSGIRSYYNLLAKSYLNKRTPEQLLEKFVNASGKRYASAPNYEKSLKEVISKMRFKEGGEYDLTDAQIAEMKAQGYEFEE